MTPVVTLQHLKPLYLGGLYLLGERLENFFSTRLNKPFLFLGVECRPPKWTTIKRQILLTTESAEVIPCDFRDFLHAFLEAS